MDVSEPSIQRGGRQEDHVIVADEEGFLYLSKLYEFKRLDPANANAEQPSLAGRFSEDWGFLVGLSQKFGDLGSNSEHVIPKIH